MLFIKGTGLNYTVFSKYFTLLSLHCFILTVTEYHVLLCVVHVYHFMPFATVYYPNPITMFIKHLILLTVH